MAKDYSKMNKEELLDEIKNLKSRKSYGLVWEDKEENVATMCQKNVPVIIEKESFRINSDNEKNNNVIIEGDNFHSLSVLNYTHQGCIDFIYIDPPYNTQSEGFIYNDKIVDNDDTYRHSKWLSFINKRLILAKKLLKDNGAIAISINEEEVFQLKLLCDEVFGENNYLTTFTVKVRHEDRILKGDKDFHEVVEYLLLYRKTFDYKPQKREQDNTSIDNYIYLIKEKTKKPKKIKFGNKEVEYFSPDQYEVIKTVPSKDSLKKINIRGSIKEGNSSGRFYMKHLSTLNKEMSGFLFKVPNMGADKESHRYFITAHGKRINGDYFQGVPLDRKDIKEVPYPNFLDFESDFNSVGYEGGVEFRNGKKPINFLRKIFEICGVEKNKNAIVLDFFAGSGSTGHALLSLNKKLGGDRKFILCTNNENKIAEQITYKRFKKLVKGDSKNEAIPSSIYYYKTDFVNVESIHNVSDKKKIELTYKAGRMVALREDTLEEIEKNDWWQIFTDKKGKITAIYFKEDKEKLDELVKKISKSDSVVLYIFSWGKNEYKNEYTDHKNIRVEDIPEPILEVYKEINKK